MNTENTEVTGNEVEAVETVETTQPQSEDSQNETPVEPITEAADVTPEEVEEVKEMLQSPNTDLLEPVEGEPEEAPYKSRLREEQSQLQERVTKLEGFIQTAEFRALSRVDRGDLKAQLKHMNRYLLVVNRRVERL